MKHGKAFERVLLYVMPAMQAKAEEEREKTGQETGPRQTHFRHWWKFWRGRIEMLDKIATIPRYIACVRVTKRPIFEFIDSAIHPNDALQVFPLPDDYSFGILQSGIHWAWFTASCSTLKRDFRYTSDTVFDTFPWPQSPKPAQVKKVAEAGVELREVRRKILAENKCNLRKLYRNLDLPGDNPLRKAHAGLDRAVRQAYNMNAKEDCLKFLLDLNFEVAKREAAEQSVTAPGLPPGVGNPRDFITDDCVRVP